MKNISNAILGVMEDVKGVEKNTTVGSGKYSYKGVTDKDVKEVFNPSFIKHKLSILPIKIEDSVTIDNWTEENNGYSKRKQSVFTSVKVTYLLLHGSGESIELTGYGHGSDAMDKSAGKATTYALKNCLLYSFLTPVRDIEDTDSHHSNDVAIAPPPPPKKLQASEKALDKLIDKINNGEKYVLKKASALLDLSEGQKNSIRDAQILHDEETK